MVTVAYLKRMMCHPRHKILCNTIISVAAEEPLVTRVDLAARQGVVVELGVGITEGSDLGCVTDDTTF
jgi:hypothetical protein